MIILENILSTLIDIPENLAEITNQKMIEVEDYQALFSTNHLVVGKVLTCEKHPNADSLSLTTVDVGDEVLKIVCGAPNVMAGQSVIVAKIGAVLPGRFEIKKAKIRGVESHGMICSLTELGFDEKVIPDVFKQGIFYFDEELKPGTEVRRILGLDGHKLTLGITANRGDLLSHLGFAYDLAAILNQKVTIPQVTYKTSQEKNDITVKIETEKCLSYFAAKLDVTVKDSPWWLKNALIHSGIRPINNVVDITNYILITYGTPLHAFDYHKVNSQQIVIREANPDEKVITLDEVERKLKKGDIVITDGKRPIALGGVMGLLNTVIDEKTTKVILEAALFDPKTIAETSKRLDLRSDSSLRFERGVEQSRVQLGMQQAIELLVKYADAKVADGISKDEVKRYQNNWIEVPIHQVNRLLGLSLSKDEVIAILERLNFEIRDEVNLKVKAPDYRFDITIQADVIEEIGRLYGFDLIPNAHLEIFDKGALTQQQKALRKLKTLLVHFGLNEVINGSLISQKEFDLFPKMGKEVYVLSPMSEDRKVLRQSLIPGLLSTVSYHVKRQIENTLLFEMGHVFSEDVERNHLGIMLKGKLSNLPWKQNEIKIDFFVLKGILLRIGEAFKIDFELKKRSDLAGLHPGIQAEVLIGEKRVGLIGMVHPSVLKDRDLEDVFVLELDLSFLETKVNPLTFETVSKYPSIRRDLSFIVSKSIPVGDVLKLIQTTHKKLITQVELFDVYEGTHVDEGNHSLAVSITFNDKEKTLATETVEKVFKSIKQRLNFEYQVKIRD